MTRMTRPDCAVMCNLINTHTHYTHTHTHVIHAKLSPDTVLIVICMYGHTYSKSMDQPGKVANPARGQLNRENEYFPVRVRA